VFGLLINAFGLSINAEFSLKLNMSQERNLNRRLMRRDLVSCSDWLGSSILVPDWWRALGGSRTSV